MSARNRVFLILGLLLVGSLIWYLTTTRRSTDLQLIGTVDANEVIVSSKIPGRIQTLTVEEGQDVTQGELIAVIESQDLQAELKAAEATEASQRYKVNSTEDTEQQNRGETSSAVVSAEAQVQAAQANLRQARAHEMLTEVSARTVDQTRADAANARALAEQAQVEEGYSQIVSPINGKVDVWATRQGEVVSAGAPIVTIMDLTQTWVYAPLPETQADAVQLHDSLRVVMPSGATIWGYVIAKSAESDFATQRDVNSMKRDIKTIQLKLLIPNPGEKFVPGMTAEVYIPKAKLVKQ